jgi:uncharacterized protein (TIGR02328 family)
MRLWHKDLIDSLPRKQLLGQWRECCAIIKNIKEKGTPNHLLVNKIMDYDLKHFYTYGLYVFIETEHRDYKCNLRKFDQYFKGGKIVKTFDELFEGWHNERYLDQCFYNLQEKFDCGGMSEEEWEKVSKKYYEVKEKYSNEQKEIEEW